MLIAFGCYEICKYLSEENPQAEMNCLKTQTFAKCFIACLIH